jgi:DNA end-binding protein Ku
MRSIWSGAISFGLVNIPVKLYSASGESALDFDMLAKPDLSRVKYKKVAASDGREVEQKDIVKGYEYQKGLYIIMEDEDFEKANVKKSRTIEIVKFVNESEIDPIYYEKPYYLEPDKNAEKPYSLLREALRQSRKIGVARHILRNREHIVALKPVGDVILLNQMRYYDDIRSYNELNLPDSVKLSENEIEMAQLLIEQLTTPFEPDKFHDTYTEELKQVIEAKANGKPIKSVEAALEPTRVDDLMAVLKASLEAGKKESVVKSRPAVKNGEKAKRKTKVK